ncbi:TetR family transcriptional regulator [Barnesiella viscericola DSM 18177]|uniref:TetR family transcriptional regulator n=1 Tax=Barnesiella viscericola DSM 18177 TaxID=880074 RepID=W0ENN5_9BACT|nr:TetR/AcrR family transcriptional regulator [Barnesiella viscericola]AHF12440.1 TetR family transcriptional regulator [Barnesiella viscericola DSM 18177]
MRPQPTRTVPKSGTTENIESRIIEAAKQEFIEKGFEQTSMSDIAAVVGINRPTLHYYFRTKDKMFQAVFASIVSNFLPHIDAIFSKQEPFEKKLGEIIDVYFDIFTANPLLPKFIIGEIHRDVDHLIDTLYILKFDQYLHHIGELLQQEIDRNHLKKVPLQFIFMTFYSQLTFPFLSHNLSKRLFFHDNPEEYTRFLAEWKQHIIAQITRLLYP